MRSVTGSFKLVNGVTSENLDLKSRVAKVELENTSLQGRIRKAEEKLEELEKLVS